MDSQCRSVSTACIFLGLGVAVVIGMANAGCASENPIHVGPEAQRGSMVLVETWNLGLQDPLGLAVDTRGYVLVSDTQHHRILVLSETGALASTWGEYGQAPGQLHSPAGLAVDREGNIYVADQGNRRVNKYDSSGTYLLTTEPDPRFPPFTDVAVDGAGRIYALSSGMIGSGKGHIFAFDAEGHLEWESTENVTGFLAVSGSLLYVNNTFYSRRNQTHFLECYRDHELLWRRRYDFDSAKGDILIDPSGNLLVVHAGLARVVHMTDRGDPVEVLVEEDRSKPSFPEFITGCFLLDGRLALLDTRYGRVCIYDQPH